MENDREIDVFISYKHDTSKHIADAICHALEEKRIRCWYIPRDAGTGPYARAIANAIKQCQVFISILDARSSESHHIRSEIDLAFKRESNGLVIIPFKVDHPELSDELEYYITSTSWIDAMTSDLEDAIIELTSRVQDIVKVQPVLKFKRERNDYLDRTPKKDEELKRNEAQSRFLNHFLKDIYDEILEGKSNQTVLDVGSGRGGQIATLLGERPEVQRIIGLDIHADLVETANKEYGSEKACFFHADCESEDFENTLEQILDKNGMARFDIINISFLLLHLEDPSKLIRILKKYMVKDGRFVISDIDDGLMMAYPDNDGLFSRSFEILSSGRTGGYRNSGREVFYILKRAEINNIALKHNGLSTVGVPLEIKDMLFKTYMDLIPIMLSEILQYNSKDHHAISDQTWFLGNRKRILDEFSSSEFMMTAGMMVYTAY